MTGFAQHARGRRKIGSLWLIIASATERKPVKKYLHMLLIMCEAFDTGTDPIDAAVSPDNIIKMAPNMASKTRKLGFRSSCN